jgi:hypothetical protein
VRALGFIRLPFSGSLLPTRQLYHPYLQGHPNDGPLLSVSAAPAIGLRRWVRRPLWCQDHASPAAIPSRPAGLAARQEQSAGPGYWRGWSWLASSPVALSRSRGRSGGVSCPVACGSAANRPRPPRSSWIRWAAGSKRPSGIPSDGSSSSLGFLLDRSDGAE